MERVRDFSPYELKVSVYDGAAEKRTMLMDGHLYMVKFGYDAARQRSIPVVPASRQPARQRVYRLQGVLRFRASPRRSHSR